MSSPPVSRTSSRTSGFTLIELMVVVTIIALLAVAILPELIKSQERSNQAVDQLNLRWHFQSVTNYKGKYKTPPRGGGHKFVLDPWIRNVVERTTQNMERYFFTQAISDGDERFAELREQEPEDYWKTQQDLDSEDTNWAGLAAAHKKGMWSGKVIWMATDNEGGNIYKDGSVVVLYGDGVAKTLLRDPDFIKVGYSAEVSDEDVIDVGPNSLHKDLQKLEH